ncbi:MAG TPA: hypothetical protein VLU25_11210 [Acidobacteriota bacterium]|nr:hypothetical protein [Acidobacteriota bacterium]
MENVATLDVNDLLRLAVQDERFAGALVKEPRRFQKAFNLTSASIAAISEAVTFSDFTLFQLQQDPCGCDGGFEYE